MWFFFSLAALGSSGWTWKTQAWIHPAPNARARRQSQLSVNTAKRNLGDNNSAPSSLSNTFSRLDPFDDTNTTPSLQILLKSIHQLTTQGSDIRGTFVDHEHIGSLAVVSQMIAATSHGPALTPFAAYCIGAGLAQLIKDKHVDNQLRNNNSLQAAFELDFKPNLTIVIGMDPRAHGPRLADSLARGAESIERIKVAFTNLATTPACAWFASTNVGMADASIMVTASHLPKDKNGFKLYDANGGFSSLQIQQLGKLAMDCAAQCFNAGVLPLSSVNESVQCRLVDWMPSYSKSLEEAILKETNGERLDGLTIVLNSGNGAGGFFQHILERLGADVSNSINIEPDSNFPKGVPNPEDPKMVAQTIETCQRVNADIGIMFDTDADRCGFVVPGQDGSSAYEPLNRNRLIALLGVVFSRSSPNCTIVTDSVTSEGLALFLKEKLGLQHCRYLKGYANIINKAKELTATGVNAQVAIETSGHCAMQENGYLDDGTFTAVKVVGLLTREKALHPDSTTSTSPLLDLISDLEEMPVVDEVRLTTFDKSLDTMRETFDVCAMTINDLAISNNHDWEIDIASLEGVRVRLGHNQFFMLRKSLHDPILSFQVEAMSKELFRETALRPLLQAWESRSSIARNLDLTPLKEF